MERSETDDLVLKNTIAEVEGLRIEVARLTKIISEGRAVLLQPTQQERQTVDGHETRIWSLGDREHLVVVQDPAYKFKYEDWQRCVEVLQETYGKAALVVLREGQELTVVELPKGSGS